MDKFAGMENSSSCFPDATNSNLNQCHLPCLLPMTHMDWEVSGGGVGGGLWQMNLDASLYRMDGRLPFSASLSTQVAALSWLREFKVY